MTPENLSKTGKLKEVTGLSDEDLEPLFNPGKVDLEVLDHMIENVVGSMTLPLGIATNFLIDGRDYLIPMAIEEPSVVAAASNSARFTRPHGGFHATDTGPIMIAQIQAIDISTPFAAKNQILNVKEEILLSKLWSFHRLIISFNFDYGSMKEDRIW